MCHISLLLIGVRVSLCLTAALIIKKNITDAWMCVDMHACVSVHVHVHLWHKKLHIMQIMKEGNFRKPVNLIGKKSLAIS